MYKLLYSPLLSPLDLARRPNVNCIREVKPHAHGGMNSRRLSFVVHSHGGKTTLTISGYLYANQSITTLEENLLPETDTSEPK